MARKNKVLKSDKSKTIELEGKRKQDNAWHDCEVSLSSADSACTSLYVHFASFKNDENDAILRKEEALACLRVRSTSLSDGECLQVKEGEAVTALQKTRAGRHYFFDAEVEKVKRLKHSNKVFCRCTFEIRWLESELKGERATVPASSIRRLVQESIADHPIVSAFFAAVKSTKHSPLSRELQGSFPEDSDVESDIHARLEQQIEEITKLADTSENVATEDTLCKQIRVNSKPSHETVDASDERTWCSKDVNGHVPVHRSPRKRNVVRSKKVPQEPIDVNIAALVHLEKRPRLSPLAARAALAAAVWDLPSGKQRMDDLNYVLEGKDQDYIGPMAQSKFGDERDKVSLNLSDTYFDIRHHNKGRRVPKIATSIARGKTSKQSSSNNFHTNQVHRDRTNTKRSDYSRLQRTHSVSITPKQEASSDIASTAKESSATTDINILPTQQSTRKRHREASKEVNSTRSRNKHLGVVPTRSSPRFRIGPVSNKDETFGSLHNRVTEKNDPTVTENAQRKTNGSSPATTVNGRKPKTEKNSPDLNDQEPESTMSINALQGRSVFSNSDTRHYKKVSKDPQENTYNHSKQNLKAASIERTKAKHLLTDDCTENTNGAITEGSKDSGYDKCALDKASLEAKKIKRPRITTSNRVEHPSLTNDSTENSLGTVEERLHSKRASKAPTSSVRKSKNVSPTHVENSDGGDKTRQKPPSGKIVCSKEGENLRKNTANSDKNLKAQLQVGPEMKNQTSSDVTRSSPRLRFLPRTRSQNDRQL